MLRFANVNLKVISGIEKYQFIASTIKGYISMTYKGHAEPNHKL